MTLAPPEPRAAGGVLPRLKALANDVRFEIVRILARGERCVCDLEALLGLPQSKVSYHLAVLREAGLVVGEPRGKNSYYRLEFGALYGLGGDVLREVFLAEAPSTYREKSVC